MAIIGKIRDRQGLLVLLIGLAMLLFVVDPQTIWNKISGNSAEKPIGEFFGAPLYDSEWNYEKRVEYKLTNERNMRMRNGQDGKLTDQEQNQIRNEIWNGLVTDTLINRELALLGIGVSHRELNEGILNLANPIQSSLSQQFYDKETFLQDSFSRYVSKMINNAKSQENGAAQLYYNIEIPLKSERQRGKYINMIKKGLVGTKEESLRKYHSDNTNASISYIFKDFNSIPDSSVVVTDADIKKYYDEHRYEKKWKNKSAYRSIKYVSIPVMAGQRDKEEAMAKMSDLKTKFANAKNDSLFVVNNAFSKVVQFDPRSGMERPTGFYSNEPYESGTYIELDEAINGGNVGDVFGPVADGNRVVIIKIRKDSARNEATVRHILINSTDADDLAGVNPKKNLADSLLRVVKADTSKFKTLVEEFSDDKGSVRTGGVYKNFREGQMVTEFNDFSFNKPIGAIDVVKTQFGYHIVEVLKRGTNSRKWVAVVDKEVVAGDATRNEIYEEKALSLRSAILEKGFDDATKELGYNPVDAPKIMLSDPNISGIGQNMSILKWAFNGSLRSVGEPEYINGNRNIILAYLYEIGDEGEPNFANCKEQMKKEVINLKKQEMIAETLGKDCTLESAQQKLNTNIKTGQVNLGMLSIPNESSKGEEPALIGEIFLLSQGEVSGVINTTRGIYVVRVDNKAIAKADAENITNKVMITEGYRNQIDNRLRMALYNVAEGKDWRMKRSLLNQ